jgi:Flp pilus assembly protein TadD
LPALACGRQVRQAETLPKELGFVTKIAEKIADVAAVEGGHMAEFKEGMELLKNEYPHKALPKLRRAFENDRRNPYYISFLGLALARAEHKFDEAAQLCREAVELKRKEIQLHMNLVEVYVLAGLREQALYALDHAAKAFGNDGRIKRARSKLQKRRPPVLAFLGRTHLLNRALGKLLHRIQDREKS